jgi:hypothetical protein
MRDFARRRGSLHRLPFESRVVYTVYVLSVLAGLGVASTLYQLGPTLDPHVASVYYAGGTLQGEPAAPPGPAGAAGTGPVLELPADELEALSPDVRESMNQRRLIELTHGHLFVMPLVWLTLTHLFVLTSAGWWALLLGGLGSAGAIALHIAAPWIIRSVPGTGWLMPVSGVLMLVTMSCMALRSLFDLWRPRRDAEV